MVYFKHNNVSAKTHQVFLGYRDTGIRWGGEGVRGVGDEGLMVGCGIVKIC